MGTSGSSRRRTSRSLDDLGAPPQALGHDAVAEGVEREDAPAHPGRAGRHLVAGLAVVGHGHDRPGLVGPVDHEVAQALGEHPGLARPRRGDHPRRARPVRHRRQLVGRQIRRRGHGRGRGPDVARLDRLGRHDGRTRGERAGVVAPRATVDPRGGAVGQGHVCRRRRPPASSASAPALTGLAAPPPDRLDPAAGVVGVGPHQEVQPVVGRVEVGRQGRRIVAEAVGPQRSRGAELGRVDPEGDDHGGAGGPVAVQRVDHVGSLGRRGVDLVQHARSIVTTGAPAHAAGTGSPTLTMTPRPRPGGPGAVMAARLPARCDSDGRPGGSGRTVERRAAPAVARQSSRSGRFAGGTSAPGMSMSSPSCWAV